MQIVRLKISHRTKPYIKAAAKAGYSYECECGELHRDVRSANACRKCRIYLVEAPADKVVFHYQEGGSR